MSGVPYSSNVSPRWSFTNLLINGVSQPVVTPPPGVSVNAPTLSVGTTPALQVGTIKQTVDELLGDNIDAPITCQALLDSADTAVFASTNNDGYHKLPPSGKKIHEHLSSGNITEIKTSGKIEAAKNANDVISYFGKAAIGDVAFDDFAGFAHHDRAGITTDYALLQKISMPWISAPHTRLLNSKFSIPVCKTSRFL